MSTDTPATGPIIAVIDPRTGNTLRTRADHHSRGTARGFGGRAVPVCGSGHDRHHPALRSAGAHVQPEFSIGMDHTGQPLEAQDIRVAPGDARTVAVTRVYKQTVPSGYGLAVFDDGVMRPDTIGTSMPVAGVQPDGALWSLDGTKIYSLSLVTSTPRYYQSAVSASGVTLQDEIPLPQERSYGFGVVDLRYVNRNYADGRRSSLLVHGHGLRSGAAYADRRLSHAGPGVRHRYGGQQGVLRLRWAPGAADVREFRSRAHDA